MLGTWSLSTGPPSDWTPGSHHACLARQSQLAIKRTRNGVQTAHLVTALSPKKESDGSHEPSYRSTQSYSCAARLPIHCPGHKTQRNTLQSAARATKSQHYVLQRAAAATEKNNNARPPKVLRLPRDLIAAPQSGMRASDEGPKYCAYIEI